MSGSGETELVTIPSLSGSHRLSAQIRRAPDSPFGPSAYMVLCPGLGEHKNTRLFQAIAAQAPLHTLAFDFRCNGQSSGSKDEWSIGGYHEEAYDDLEGVKRWIRETRGGDVRILLGHSRGANVVLMNAARFDDVPFIISLAGRFDLSVGLEPYFHPGDRAKLERGEVHLVNCARDFGDGVKRVISIKDLKKRLAIHPEELQETLQRTKRVFVIHGSADSVIPPTDAIAIAAHCPEHKSTLKVIDSADHQLRTSKEPNGYMAVQLAMRECYAAMLQNS